MKVKYLRLFAGIVDYGLLITLCMLISSLPKISFQLLFYELSSTFILSSVFMLSYMPLKDLLFRNASIGKRLFKLQMVSSETLEKASVGKILLRNLVESIGIVMIVDLVLMLLDKEKLADRICGTAVIKK